MQSSQASPILILDLVSKFLSKVLEKDRNQSYYLKQWESFKGLLSANPLDLNPVFSHLATIVPQPESLSDSPELNTRSPGLNSRSPQLSKPGLKTRPSSSSVTEQYGHTKNRSFHVSTDRDGVVTSFQASSNDNSHEGLSYLEAEVPCKRTSSNAGMININVQASNPVDLRRHTSYKPSTFANIGDGPTTGEIKSTPFSLEEMLNGSLGHVGGIPSAELKTNQPYHMGFLTSIAKQLRDGIERRSDNAIKSFSQSKQDKAFIPSNEPRSPLRKMKVYEKQKEKQEFDLSKLLGGGSLGGGSTYTSVNTTAGSKLDYMSRVKLY